MSAIDLTDAWLEWHETCALDLCSGEHIRQLCVVSNHLYTKTVERLRNDSSISTLEPFIPYSSEKDPNFRRTFHIMEAECIPLGTREERRQYKERIFDGASEPGAVTGYFFSKFFRSYIKRKENLSFKKQSSSNDEMTEEEMIDYFAQGNYTKSRKDTFFNEQEAQQIQTAETGSGNTAPASAPSKKTGKGRVLPGNMKRNDPDTDSAVDKIDFQDIGAVARKFWNGLSETDHAALYTYLRNIPMSTPELLEKVELGKTSFSERPVKLFQSVQRGLGSMEQGEQIRYIGIFLDTLKPCCQEWEETSDLGKWIVSHFRFATENGKKQRFSSDVPEK